MAATREWDEDGSLDWGLADQPYHGVIGQLIADLNALYQRVPALHELDFEPLRGFQWIDCQDDQHSVVSFVRRDRFDNEVVVCLNFTPSPRGAYRIGVPAGGHYLELLNSDAQIYQGSNVGNMGGVEAEVVPWMGLSNSLQLQLPPLAALVLQRASV